MPHFEDEIALHVQLDPSIDPGLVRIGLFPEMQPGAVETLDGGEVTAELVAAVRPADGTLEVSAQTVGASQIEGLSLLPQHEGVEVDDASFRVSMKQFEREVGPFADGDTFVLVGWVDEDRDGRLDVEPVATRELALAPSRLLRCGEERYSMWLLDVSWIEEEQAWVGSANADGVPCFDNQVVEGETDWTLVIPSP